MGIFSFVLAIATAFLLLFGGFKRAQNGNVIFGLGMMVSGFLFSLMGVIIGLHVFKSLVFYLLVSFLVMGVCYNIQQAIRKRFASPNDGL